jgi:hypothetical protein
MIIFISFITNVHYSTTPSFSLGLSQGLVCNSTYFFRFRTHSTAGYSVYSGEIQEQTAAYASGS